MKYNKKSRGFVGLLGLLISVAFIAFLSWRLYIKEDKEGDEKPTVQSGLNAVKEAEALKNKLEVKIQQSSAGQME